METSPQTQSPESRRLIYEKSNTYRLHADNLRWTLLFGYAAFVTGVLAALPDITQSTQLQPYVPYLSFLLFLISNLYLFILAVQNWFYVLFADFVNECESKLLADQPLRTMQEFAKERGGQINGFHPAFFFALVIVVLTSSAFLMMTIEPWIETSPLLPWAKVLLSVAIFVLLLTIYLGLFKNWDRCVYKPIIQRLSSLLK